MGALGESVPRITLSVVIREDIYVAGPGLSLPSYGDQFLPASQIKVCWVIMAASKHRYDRKTVPQSTQVEAHKSRSRSS